MNALGQTEEGQFFTLSTEVSWVLSWFFFVLGLLTTTIKCLQSVTQNNTYNCFNYFYSMQALPCFPLLYQAYNTRLPP